MWEAAAIVLIGAGIFLWIDSLRARERAVEAGRSACKRYALQFLDDTVSFARLALARAVKTWAIASGRTFVTPDDVRELAEPVLAHRIIVDPESEFAGVTGAEIVGRAIVEVEPPAYRAA